MKHICKSISQPGEGHFETSALKKKKKKKAFPEISFKHLTLNFPDTNSPEVTLENGWSGGGGKCSENRYRLMSQ